jgi:hypothetical protein
VDAILRRHPDKPAKIFVIWEPILSTDWSPPTTFAMRRIRDRRTQQYWDPDHHVARKLAADARSPQPAHDCCERSGILWDLAAVYPPGRSWNERMPPAVVFNGSVVDVASEIESALTAIPK